MIFTQREIDLITRALYILECQCMADELHFEIKNELGGTPSDEEVRELMERFEK